VDPPRIVPKLLDGSDQLVGGIPELALQRRELDWEGALGCRSDQSSASMRADRPVRWTSAEDIPSWNSHVVPTGIRWRSITGEALRQGPRGRATRCP
jgi:hypothetical protein